MDITAITELTATAVIIASFAVTVRWVFIKYLPDLRTDYLKSLKEQRDELHGYLTQQRQDFLLALSETQKRFETAIIRQREDFQAIIEILKENQDDV